jgi:2-polyprenyl-6-methoxyphenol hydroxylase-like FAD-dependent oxidoreductase
VSAGVLDLLIVGAGPTGLAIAAEGVRHGLWMLAVEPQGELFRVDSEGRGGRVEREAPGSAPTS